MPRFSASCATLRDRKRSARGITLIEIAAALALMSLVVVAAISGRARLLDASRSGDLRLEAVALLEKLVSPEQSTAIPTAPLPTDRFRVQIADRREPAADAMGLKIRRYSVYPINSPGRDPLAWVEVLVVQPMRSAFTAEDSS
ncbi:MAG: hypothetical protein AAGJ38_00710 [Planctomycetota bacterium]